MSSGGYNVISMAPDHFLKARLFRNTLPSETSQDGYCNEQFFCQAPQTADQRFRQLGHASERRFRAVAFEG